MIKKKQIKNFYFFEIKKIIYILTCGYPTAAACGQGMQAMRYMTSEFLYDDLYF